MIGPHVAPKKMTKRFAAMSAVMPQAPGRLTLPSTVTAWAKHRAMTPSETAIPAEPAMSRGRLPTRSTEAIATTVTTMFVTEVMTVIVIESLSAKPTACHSVDE